jgi:DNA polymerase III epsilon subunit-like protein
MKDQNYLALDLELNNKNDGSRPKIIEVGIAIGSPVGGAEAIYTQNWYLNPEEPIEPSITALTGITTEMVQTQSVSHETLAQELGGLIDKYECFVNPVTWGQGDAEELRNELRERGIAFPYFGRRIFDVKTLHCFQQIVRGKTPAGGLRSSMSFHKFPFAGTPHRAKDDALNTLRLFFYLLQKEKHTQNLIAEFKKL